MKVQLIIRQIGSAGFSIDIPAIDSVDSIYGKNIEELLAQLYSSLAGKTFEVKAVEAESFTFTKEDRILEIYVYPGRYYSLDGLRTFERYAFQVLEAFPGARAERTKDAIQINLGEFGDETGVIVILTPDAVELRLPDIEWVGSHTPVSVNHLWQKIEGQQLQSVDLVKWVKSGQRARQQTFRECKYCGKKNPPGWMHREDVCDSCAEKHLGIIH